MNEDLITELGLEKLTSNQQESVIEELNMRVGQALVADLSEAQVREYEQILNGEQAVITAWLEANEPNYKDEVAYKQLDAGSDDDPEKVPADKVYASMAWVEKNSPNFAEVVATIKADLKAKIAAL